MRSQAPENKKGESGNLLLTQDDEVAAVAQPLPTAVKEGGIGFIYLQLRASVSPSRRLELLGRRSRSNTAANMLGNKAQTPPLPRAPIEPRKQGQARKHAATCEGTLHSPLANPTASPQGNTAHSPPHISTIKPEAG